MKYKNARKKRAMRRLLSKRYGKRGAGGWTPLALNYLAGYRF